MNTAPATRLPESTRVEAFSDGVLAIALTLLILDLHAPEGRGGFGSELRHAWPSYLAYLAAFFNIAAVWVNHHDLFTRVRAVDARLLCLNLGVLLASSVLPWPAAVIASAVRNGDRHDQVVAALLYAAVGLAVPCTFAPLYAYLARSPVLLVEPGSRAYMEAGLRRSGLSLIGFLAAAVLAFIEPVAALVIFVAIPAGFIAALLRPPPDQLTPVPTADPMP